MAANACPDCGQGYRYQNGADRMYVFGSGEEAQDLAQFTTSDESATDGKRT